MTSSSNIVKECGRCIEPKPTSAPAGVPVGWPKQDALGHLDFDHAGDRPTDADHASLAEGESFVPVYLAQQPAAVDEVPLVLREALAKALSPKSGAGAIREFQVLAGNYIHRLIERTQPQGEE